MGKKVLIVGGVAGGASAAARLRRLSEDLEIILFERGEFISFANCGLPYHIGEVIKDRESLLIQTPEAMKARFNIDVRIFSEVISIDSSNKRILVNSKDKGIYEEKFDYLILSPGAKPIKLDMEESYGDKIHTLKNIGDMDSIKNKVDQGNIQSALVIGGGYIGVEAAENLIHRGVNTTLVQATPHILAPFDSEMVVIAEKELEDNGVNLVLGDGVKSFKEEDKVVKVTLSSGKVLSADIVIMAIGVVPDVKFLEGSGIELGKKGHIIVDEHMETNIEGIYAVGDAIEVVDFVNGNKSAIPLAGPANRQGRIAADNICNISSSYKGTLGSSIIKIFEIIGASTGNNERTLKNLDIPYDVVYTYPNSHASYYPGSTQMTLKLIFNKKGEILGAQGFGYEGVDKVIDVIATVIKLKGTVDDLADLELCYAPPYNSAKSPANMLGFVVQNTLNGLVENITLDKLKNYNEESQIILDIRENLEWDNGHIKSAVHIPLDSLRERAVELDKNKEIIVYCQVGLRGYIAARILSSMGFKVKNFTGGYKLYKLNKFKPKGVEHGNIYKDFKVRKEENRCVSLLEDKSLSSNTEEIEDLSFDSSLDACGLCCPGPLMNVKSKMDILKEGEVLRINASDPGFYEDIKSWSKTTGNKLLSLKKEKGIITAYVKKNTEKDEITRFIDTSNNKDNKTMVVFSGDLDKAIASFIIANGAASMGKRVTMFFTFWGINILRKNENVTVKKSFMEKMFGFMMPKGSKKLKLSNMNMAGMGPLMIRKIMKDKNVDSLESLIKSAVDSGIEIVACQMSMDLLGLKQEELIEGVKIGGVGYYLGQAEESNVNLFI
ncbi:DsrE/DsrF/DrsH-like family protein [Hathewaya histolytica]|uniref:CoA-disulfide reductase-like protein n=1 Tax=Hathewaya histolytica TaxID=1498 RepID=A0A4U9QT96_HATHI|nr:DsrE/DsrF/DrsH-like family protein [Hathewaya histolytica]VTQ81642.1 CoA-disulfide reductase-like protein [Hathewaya histolytica]